MSEKSKTRKIYLVVCVMHVFWKWETEVACGQLWSGGKGAESSTEFFKQRNRIFLELRKAVIET